MELLLDNISATDVSTSLTSRASSWHLSEINPGSCCGTNLPNVGRVQKVHASSRRMIAAVLKIISVSALMQFYFLCEAIVWLAPGVFNTM